MLFAHNHLHKKIKTGTFSLFVANSIGIFNHLSKNVKQKEGPQSQAKIDEIAKLVNEYEGYYI